MPRIAKLILLLLKLLYSRPAMPGVPHPLPGRYSATSATRLLFFSSRRRHTRCSRDWSSDVCSSDLPVPELVFVNCCHLGASSPDLSRPEFAASVAQALIGIGVRCVVAAGWAVDDAVAAAFADTFYKRLLEGDRFMDAVFLAREEAHAKGGNTWAASQCYGDPNWTLTIAGADPQKPAPPPGPEFAGVTSALALALALETIAIECQSRMPKFTPKEVERQRLKIRYLETLPAAAGWSKRGDVAGGDRK